MFVFKIDVWFELQHVIRVYTKKIS